MTPVTAPLWSPEAPTTSPTRQVPVQRHRHGEVQWAQDQVICERPVALVFNGISHAVMMATPSDLEDFGLGFALSEGLIAHTGECHDLDVKDSAAGIEVHMQISARAFAAMQLQRRALEGRTGCGLCGVDSLQALQRQHPPALGQASHEPAGHAGPILQAFAQLQARQALQADTGGCHAAAWATPQGQLLAVREDVGRHNALDKLIGHLARTRQLHPQGLVLMSSRASYELVSKCARLGLRTLATISAPTSMAIELAQDTGVQLYGFCRGHSAVLYTATRSDT